MCLVRAANVSRSYQNKNKKSCLSVTYFCERSTRWCCARRAAFHRVESSMRAFHQMFSKRQQNLSSCHQCRRLCFFLVGTHCEGGGGGRTIALGFVSVCCAEKWKGLGACRPPQHPPPPPIPPRTERNPHIPSRSVRQNTSFALCLQIRNHVW